MDSGNANGQVQVSHDAGNEAAKNRNSYNKPKTANVERAVNVDVERARGGETQKTARTHGFSRDSGHRCAACRATAHTDARHQTRPGGRAVAHVSHDLHDARASSPLALDANSAAQYFSVFH